MATCKYLLVCVCIGAGCIIGSRSTGKWTPPELSRIRGKAPPSPPHDGVIGISCRLASKSMRKDAWCLEMLPCMRYSWCNKSLGERGHCGQVSQRRQPKSPLRAATEMGTAHNLFSTMLQEFPKKYMMFTTMGHTARHPHHYWRPAQQFQEAIGAQRKPLQPWHIQVDCKQHPVLSVRWLQPTPLLKRGATGVQLCASAMLHTLHVSIVVGGVDKRPIVQRG